MGSRIIKHANRHSIAYLALACSMLALAGASYAATTVGTSQLKNGAVTEPKIKNKVIDPVKWDPIYVTAFARRFANVSASGQYLAGSPNGSSKELGPTTTGTGTTTSTTTTTGTTSTPTGVYEVTWGDAFASFCSPLVTVNSTPATDTTPGTDGFADATIQTQANNATLVVVHTFDTHGTPTPEPFSISVMCPRGAGGSQTYPYTLP